jgi:NADH-ubiquinone oxidoreductase chain 6
MNSFNLLLEFLTLISLISALCVITSTNPVIAIVFLIVLFVNVGIYLILMGLQFIGLSYLLVYVGAITVLFLFIVMMLSSNAETDSFVDVGADYKKLLPLVFLITVLFLILFSNLIPSFFIDFTNTKFVLTVYSTINTFILSLKDDLFIKINDPSFLSSLLFEPNFLFYNNNWVGNIAETYNTNFEDFSLIDINSFGAPSALLFKTLQIQSLGEAIYGPYSILLIFSGFLLLLAMVCPIILARSASPNPFSK